MERNIKIGSNEYKMKASAATLVHYRNEFGADMLTEISLYARGNNSTSVIERSAYIMAKDAGETLPAFEEWLEGFNLTDFNHAAKDIVKLWNENSGTVVTSKKKDVPSNVK